MGGPEEGTSGFEFITSYDVWSIFSAQSMWRWERVVHRACQVSAKLAKSWADRWARYCGRRTSGTGRAHTQLVLTKALAKLVHYFEGQRWKSQHEIPVNLLLSITLVSTNFLLSPRNGFDTLQESAHEALTSPQT